jgi:hypothetical protein
MTSGRDFLEDRQVRALSNKIEETHIIKNSNGGFNGNY